VHGQVERVMIVITAGALLAQPFDELFAAQRGRRGAWSRIGHNTTSIPS
jgi:hypothetical protein